MLFRSLSLPHLQYTIHKLLKKKDAQIAGLEDKITHLLKEVETQKKLSEEVHTHITGYL